MAHQILARLKGEAAGVCRIVRLYPSTLVWPLLLLGLVLGLGIWGVNHVGQVEETSNKDQAFSLATSAAVFLSQQLTAAISPIHLMAVMVSHDPQYDVVQSLFRGLARGLLAQTPPNLTQMIEYMPNGVVRELYPLEGNEAAEGFNVFSDPTERDGAVQMVWQNTTVLSGPHQFVQGGSGFIARVPIFVSGVAANETFGLPDPLDPYCGAPCAYNATTRTKFWGIAAALINQEALTDLSSPSVKTLEDLGFRYEIRGLGFSTDVSIAVSSTPPSDPVEVTLPIADKQVSVLVSPAGGWRSDVYGGLLSGVVVLAVALALLMFAALVSRKRHQMLLEALLPKDLIRDLHGTDTTLLDARILQAETTADLMLSLLNRLLEGYMPDLRDVVFIRQAIIRGADLYQPTDLKQHIRNANLDKDVARNLMQQLGQEATRGSAFSTSYDPLCDDEPLSATPCATGSFAVRSSPQHLQQQQQGYATLTGALALILAPHPTSLREAGDSFSDEVPLEGGAATTTAGTTAQTLTRDLDPAAVVTSSPRPSNINFVSRAISFLREGGGGGGGGGGFGGGGTSITTAGRLSIEMPVPQASETVGPLAAAVSGRPRPVVSMVDLPASAFSPEDDESDPARACSATSTTAEAARDDNTMARTGAPVRRPPRKVASALGPGAFAAANNLRRRSLLLSITNGTAAAGGPSISGAGQAAGLVPSSSRRVSFASVMDVGPVQVPEDGPVPVGDQPPVSGRGGTLTLGTGRRNLAAGASRILKALPPALPPPPLPIIEEVERLLATADSWQFDTWRLRDVTNGHALSALGFFLIHRAGLIERLNLRPAVLARLLCHIEAGYNDNPYHNATHAADVLQTLHVIIHGAQLHVHYLDQLGLLAAYFAAIVHDYGHPGLTNDFLIATSDPLAVRYNDRSPLENHHAAASFGLLQRPGLDVLLPLSKSERAAFRKQVIEMVLATDVKQHFALLSQFNTAHRLASFAHNPSTAKAGLASRVSGNLNLDLQEVVVDMDADCKHLAPKPLDETERLLSLQLAIKAADLGHLGEELDVHQRWLAGLEEEFFRQGDKERALGLPISPLFDRAKQGVSKSQVGFYDFVALPLVHALCSAFPGTQPLMSCFLGNYHYWKSVEGSATTAQAAPKRGSVSVRPETPTSASQLPDLEKTSRVRT